MIPAVGEKLWNLDIQGLKLQMEPVLPSVSASYIKIMNEKAELVYENKKHDFSPKYPILKTYKIHNPLKGNANEFVGTMEIEYFKDYVIEGVEERSLIILLSNVIKTAIVASVLLIIFNRKIAKPILEISSYFNNNRDLNNVSPEGFAPSNRSGASDELSLMIDQISLREKKIFEWSQINKNKIEIAEQALNDADEMIQHEKLRAESSARLAQLGEMAASIAHEINNPLTIIVGYNYLIRSEIKKPNIDVQRIDDTTMAVERTIHRISKIITGLRTYARDGEQDQMEPTLVAKILEDTIAMTETKLRINGVKFLFDNLVDPELVLACRSVQVVQVLVALINNAIDAIDELPERWIELKSEKVDDNFRIMLTDSGQGIPPEVVKKMFEPFFTTKPVGVGTGLGLSISYGIVLSHGGKIFVDEKCPNTRFVIEFPLNQVAVKLAS